MTMAQVLFMMMSHRMYSVLQCATQLRVGIRSRRFFLTPWIYSYLALSFVEKPFMIFFHVILSRDEDDQTVAS